MYMIYIYIYIGGTHIIHCYIHRKIDLENIYKGSTGCRGERNQIGFVSSDTAIEKNSYLQ